jgi:hypothetical protein
LLGLLPLLCGFTAADPHVGLRASIEPETGAVSGTLTWRLTNTTALPLAEAWLFRYPDAFAVDPGLDDILGERVYPSGFDPAGQELGDVLVTLDAGGDRPARPEEFEQDGVPLIRVPLPRPLLPGESATLSGGFTTTVPRRFGTFGRYRGTLTVNGGLAPMPLVLGPDGWRVDEPPARLPYEAELSLPEGWDLSVAGASPDPDAARFVRDARRDVDVSIEPAGAGRQLVRLRAEGLRWISLSARRERASSSRSNVPLDEETALSWFGAPLRRGQTRWLRRAAAAARTTLAEVGLELGDVVLVEAPLRRNLVELGEGVIYVSDRFFEAETLFWRYHDLHLARAMMAEVVERLALPRESARLEPLVTHGVSWRLVPRYLGHRWRNHPNLRQFLDRLSFLPEVDNILETPVFPFADQIFDDPWVVDPLRADVRRFNRPLRTGRTLLIRLEDRLGADALEAGVEAWLRGDGGLFEGLEARTGQPVLDLVEHWMGPVARVNLSVDGVERARTDDGGWRTRVTIRRTLLEGSPVDEVVEVRLDPAFGTAGRQTLIWRGQEEVASWEVETRQRVASVVVDPRGRILEFDGDGISLKKDNRLPRATKVTGMAYVVAADGVGGVEASGFVGFRPRHDLQHQARLRVWTDAGAWVGGGPSYTYSFGPPRIGSFRQHRISASVDVQYLKQGYRSTDAPLLLNASVGWVWDTRSAAFSPLRGERIAATVFFGRDFAWVDDAARRPEDAGFAGVDFEARKLIPLHPWHVLALRGKVGLVGGSVEHRHFALGGNNDLRGTPADYRVGRFRALVGAEWRHDFIKDADVPLPLMRARGLQGALFVEGGLVGRELDKPPEAADAGVSIGYAVRVYLDWGGVLPAMGGVEIAWSPNVPNGRLPALAPPEDWPEVPFQLYFVASQSF